MKKGVTIVFIANMINMFFSVISSFILPKYLSIESYGYFKVFQLYVNYLGIAHLGFVDGIYLKYGGKEIRKLDFNEIVSSAATIRNLQIIITIIALFVGIIINNPLAIFLALSCVPVNMISFYKNLYQATGEFKDYGAIISIQPIIIFISNMLLLFILRTDNYILYILVVIISNLFLYVLLEYKSKQLFEQLKIFTFNINLLIDNIKSGICLTIGNFASIMITSIDRWFIQILMSMSDFSYYSFAVSVENLFNVCLSAVTTTLYNYLCRVKEKTEIIKLKSICLVIGIYLVAIAFPVKFIIDYWLKKYVESISCLFLLICAHSYYFVIKAIYINLYKARGQQKHYFYQMLIILVIATGTNMFGYLFIAKIKEIFACMSLLTAIIWFFICYFEFKDIKGNGKEILLMLLSTVIFLFSGLFITNSIIGCFFYLFIISLLFWLIDRSLLMSTYKIAVDFISKNLRIKRN